MPDRKSIVSWAVGAAALLVVTVVAVWYHPLLSWFLVGDREYCEQPRSLENPLLTWLLMGLAVVVGLAMLAGAGSALWRTPRADGERWADALAATAFTLGALAFAVPFYRLEAGHATESGWTSPVALLRDVAATITPLAWFSGVGLCCLLAPVVRRSPRVAVLLLNLLPLSLFCQLIGSLLVSEWGLGETAGAGYCLSGESMTRTPFLAQLHAGSPFAAIALLGVLVGLLVTGVRRRRRRLLPGDLVWWAHRTAAASVAGAVFLLAAGFVVRDELQWTLCNGASYPGPVVELAVSRIIIPSVCFLVVALLGFAIVLALKIMASPTMDDPAAN